MRRKSLGAPHHAGAVFVSLAVVAELPSGWIAYYPGADDEQALEQQWRLGLWSGSIRSLKHQYVRRRRVSRFSILARLSG